MRASVQQAQAYDGQNALTHLTHEQIKEICRIRRAYQLEWNTLEVCNFVADAIAGTFGWEAVTGQFVGDGEYAHHCWNVMPDGTIVDATADQFGLTGIYIAEPRTVEYSWYQPNMKLRKPWQEAFAEISEGDPAD